MEFCPNCGMLLTYKTSKELVLICRKCKYETKISTIKKERKIEKKSKVVVIDKKMKKLKTLPTVDTVCPKCEGKLVLTVTKAGITKYVDLATKIVKDHNLPVYYQQRIDIAKRMINSLFSSDEDIHQTTLKGFTPSNP